MINRMNRHALAIAMLCCAPAYAATQFGESVTLTGFGTIGATTTNSDEAQYRVDIRQGRGADKGIDLGVDSKLGIQANAKFNETFSAVGQILVSRRLSGSASMEWLYGQAKLPAGFDVKLGRMVLPTFMLSDSRNVGFAVHWLRAPQEVYALYPASSFDGGQLVYRNAIGPVNLTAQLSAGEARSEILFGAQGKVKFSNLRSLNLLAESGDWLFRVGQTVGDSATPGLPIPTATDKFTGVGMQYDNGNAIVMTEYATRRQSGIGFLDSNSWYVSAGWRFGNWTPYVSLSRFTPKGIGFGGIRDSTNALGVRWNAMSNLALKAQVQSTQGMATGFLNPTPAFATGHPSVRVLSLAVDFVF